jgi:hypothetical protein
VTICNVFVCVITAESFAYSNSVELGVPMTGIEVKPLARVPGLQGLLALLRRLRLSFHREPSAIPKESKNRTKAAAASLACVARSYTCGCVRLSSELVKHIGTSCSARLRVVRVCAVGTPGIPGVPELPAYLGHEHR